MVFSANASDSNRKSTIWYLENFNLFKGLNSADKLELEKLAIVEQKVKKSIIYFPVDTSYTLYLVKTGKIKISRLAPNGQELVLDMLGPGEIFGELALTGQSIREEQAEVVEEALICGFRTHDFEQFLYKNPELNLQVLKLIGLRLKKVQVRLENLFFKNATERIIHFLQELAAEQGQPLANNNGIVIKLNLSHANIAKLTATNRQKVNTVLKELEKQGIITYNRKRLYIKNLALLDSAKIIP